MKTILILFPLIAILAACDGNRNGDGKTIVRIAGKAFTEEDLNTRLGNLPDERREEILRNPEERRANFENILRGRLFAMAGQQSGFGNRDSLTHRLSLFDQRVITQFYFGTYISEYGMHSRKEIEEYYRSNPSKFMDDSGKIQPLSKAFSPAADSLLVSQSNLDSFYQGNRNLYADKAHCFVSVIENASRKNGEAALKALKGGMSFGDAAAKYSVHPSRNNQGQVGRVNKGEGSQAIGGGTMVDSLLFEANGRLQPGQMSGLIAKDTDFIIVRPDSCKEEYLAPLDSRRIQVASDFIRDFKSKKTEKAVEDLKVKYNVKLVSPYKTIAEKDIRAYYDQNKDAYESPEGYELYHIEVSDKAKVGARFNAVKDLDGFKTLASKISENPLTKSQGGYVGLVRRDLCLPYGIGMFPSLFPELDKVNPGKLTEPLQSTDTQKWHFFWLVKKEPRQPKPLERVHGLVKSDLESNRVTDIKPGDTLATFGDGRVLRESDVIFLREEIPPQMQDRYTRDNLVNFLLTWQLATDEVKALGLESEKRLIAARLQNEDDFWSKLYQENVMTVSYEQDSSLLAKTFLEKRDLFTKDSTDRDWHKYAHDVAAYLTLTPEDFNIEFYTNVERYQRDTALSALSTVMYDVFQNLKATGYQRLDAKILAALKVRYEVQIVDPTLQEPSLEPAAETYKVAQNYHYDRKLDKALDLYGKLRAKFPERTALQDSICFGLAQIYLEQERYQQAMAEYRRVSYLYPGSANNYKAMFMVGFIYSEHLKNDSAAVHAFEKMLAKYPSTDLSDDADWMIRNIRSGGKLMPKLEGDTTSAPEEKPRQ